MLPCKQNWMKIIISYYLLDLVNVTYSPYFQLYFFRKNPCKIAAFINLFGLSQAGNKSHSTRWWLRSKHFSGHAVSNRNMHKWSALRKYKALHFIYLIFPAYRFSFTVLEYHLNSVSIAYLDNKLDNNHIVPTRYQHVPR